MKKIIFSLGLLLLTFVSHAQATNVYNMAMQNALTKLQSAKNSPEAYQEAANGFLRIAGTEKKDWLPKYYAAYSLIMEAMFSTKREQIDPILDQADELLSDISVISPKNDEIICLQAFSKSTRIGVDPITRGRTFGSQSAKFLSDAKGINPDNPRIYFLQAQSAFYTPEQFGGGKKVAKALFSEALVKYEKFKPKSELMPNWGKEATIAMIAKCGE